MDSIKIVSGSEKLNVRVLCQLWKSVGWCGKSSSVWQPQRLLEALKHSDDLYTVWDGTVLVGLLAAKTDSLNVYLSYLLVDANYQRKGIGSALMHKFMAEHVNDMIFILTEEAGTFYSRFGFEQKGISLVSLPKF